MMAHLTRDQWLFCLRLGLAMTLAYFVTHGLSVTNGIYAVLGAGLTTAPSFGEGIGISKDRLVATMLGVLISIPASWTGHPVSALVLGLGAAIPLGMILGGAPVARISATIAAVSVLLHQEESQFYGLLRFTNTLAGVCVAFVVGCAFWPVAGRRDLSQSIKATLKASSNLLTHLHKDETAESALEAQRTLFFALSAMLKSTTNAKLDPLLYRQRQKLIQEARLVAMVGVSLLSISLVRREVEQESEPADAADIENALHQRIAGKLQELEKAYGGEAVMRSEGRGHCAPIDAVAANALGRRSVNGSHTLVGLIATDRLLDDLDAARRLGAGP